MSKAIGIIGLLAGIIIGFFAFDECDRYLGIWSVSLFVIGIDHLIVRHQRNGA